MGFSLFRWRPNSGSGLERALRQVRTGAFFCPTPFAVARQMLELANVQPDDVVYDLGSGDGRIPIMAAQEFGCQAVGVELDRKLYRYAQDKVTEYGLQNRVRFQQEDFFRCDLREATVVTLYLFTSVNGYLGLRLASQLRPGARVVALDYQVPGWRYEQSHSVRSEGDVEYTLYLYRRR